MSISTHLSVPLPAYLRNHLSTVLSLVAMGDDLSNGRPIDLRTGRLTDLSYSGQGSSQSVGSSSAVADSFASTADGRLSSAVAESWTSSSDMGSPVRARACVAQPVFEKLFHVFLSLALLCSIGPLRAGGGFCLRLIRHQCSSGSNAACVFSTVQPH